MLFPHSNSSTSPSHLFLLRLLRQDDDGCNYDKKCEFYIFKFLLNKKLIFLVN